MDERSEAFLVQVHPDLCAVMRAAAQTVPFRIVYGLRTLAAEQQAVMSGHSQTMHSRHLANAQGLACAVDVAHLDDAGNVDWAAGREAAVYGAIAGEVMAASKQLGIHVQWGGSWNETAVPEAPTAANPHPFHDWGHFQLPWALYP